MRRELMSVALGAALAVSFSTNGLASPQAGDGAAAALSVASPDGRLALGFETDAQGMRWTLARDGKALVLPSRLGVAFAVGSPLEKGAERLAEMKVLNVRRASSDTTWTTRLSRRETVRDRYNEMSVELEEAEARAVRVGLGQTSVEKSPRRLTLVFRAYDEGVAFRYVFPEQAAFDGFALTDELTEWRFAPDAQAWTTTYATARDPQEEPFAKGPLAAVDPKRFVGMPVLVETQGATLALCEAALFNWAGLYFRASGAGGTRSGASGPVASGAATLRAALAKLPPTPAADPAVAVIATTPAKSPWRVALVGDDEVDLLRKNDLIASLNPPPDPAIDFSFVKPGASTWDWWTESNNALSTALTLKLVDFAAEMGWPYHTVDGGWYGFARRPNHGPNVPLQPQYYAVLREAFDGRFYYAATTVARRELALTLDFLGEGEWTMAVYADDPARTPQDAQAISCTARTVRRGETVRFALGDEGGAVAVFSRRPERKD